MPRNALQSEMRPTPRNALLGLFADALTQGRNFADKAQIPAGVPLIGGQGVGSLFVGKAPEELNEWSYGNAPMRINPNAGKTASFVPEMKPGRQQQVADLLFAAQVPGGKNALAMGMGALDSGAVNKAATVWHGSPHKFDKFDSSKIGTGEGAQAYGHGLYLAESPDVATTYANMRAAPNMEFHTASGRKLTGLEKSIADDMLSNGKASAMVGARANGPEWMDAFNRIKDETITRGNLYKVDLPDEKIARMLDWDAPLSQQAPGVRQAIGNSLQSEAPDFWKAFRLNDRTGGVAQGAVASRYGVPAPELNLRGGGGAVMALQEALGEKAATKLLRTHGIPGIRYLDGSSRGAGGGTSNFVLFPGEENALTILERNGQRLR